MDFEAVSACYENQKEIVETQKASNIDEKDYQQIYDDCLKEVKKKEITDAGHDAATIYLRHIPDSKIKEISYKNLIQKRIPENINNKVDDTDIFHLTMYIESEIDFDIKKPLLWEKAKFINFEWEEVVGTVKDFIIHENLSVRIIIESKIIPWELQWYQGGAELWTGDEQYQHLVHPTKVIRID